MYFYWNKILIKTIGFYYRMNKIEAGIEDIKNGDGMFKNFFMTIPFLYRSFPQLIRDIYKRTIEFSCSYLF